MATSVRLPINQLNNVQLKRFLQYLKLPVLEQYWKKKNYTALDGEMVSLVQNESDLTGSYFPPEEVPILVTRKAVKYLLEEFIPKGVPLRTVQSDEIPEETPDLSSTSNENENKQKNKKKRVRIVEDVVFEKPAEATVNDDGVFKKQRKNSKSIPENLFSVSPSSVVISPEQYHDDDNRDIVVNTVEHNTNEAVSNETTTVEDISSHISPPKSVHIPPLKATYGKKSDSNSKFQLEKMKACDTIGLFLQFGRSFRGVDFPRFHHILNFLLMRVNKLSQKFDKLYDIHQKVPICKVVVEFILYVEPNSSSQMTVINVAQEILITWLKLSIVAAEDSDFQINASEKMRRVFVVILDYFVSLPTSARSITVVRPVILAMCKIIQTHIQEQSIWWKDESQEQLENQIKLLLSE